MTIISSPHSIQSLSNDGRGVLREESGRVVFVEGGLPSETVHYEISKEKSSYAEGIVTKIISSFSPVREENPPCPVASVCGGCQLQFVKQEEQTSFKLSWLKESLLKIAKINPPVIVEILKQTQYRRRVQIKFSKNSSTIEMKDTLSSSRTALGFYKKKSHNIIKVTNCLIAHPKISEFLLKQDQFLNSLPNCEGELEITVDDNENLRFRLLKGFLKTDHFFLEKEAPTRSSLSVNKNTYPKRDFSSNKSNPISLEQSIKTSLNSLGYVDGPLSLSLKAIDKRSFVQAHKDVSRIYKNDILSYITNILDEIKDPVSLYDLYCGYGEFSAGLLSLQENKKYQNRIISLTAVEENPYSMSSFLIKEEETKNFTAPFKISLVNKTVEAFLYDFKPTETPIFIINPPRTGIGQETIKRLLSLLPPQSFLLYLSCDAPSFSRDAKEILQENFLLRSLKLYDAFPYTVHFETLALFSRLEI